jgi:formylglycine-generating enzyme required for sulfatase activity
VRRWLATAAVSILVLGTALIAGSCWNPLNWALQAMGNMVEVPGGTMTLGNVEGYAGGFADELPFHDVTLSTFLLSRYEVTQELYQEVIGDNPSWFQLSNGFSDEPTRPVERVTWQDAIRFCNELSLRMGLDPVYTIDAIEVTWDTAANGYRLPTEAEWEYAARGGQASEGFWLAGSNLATDVAWFPDNSTWDTYTASYITSPVGELGSNELDLYDMSGNVCEWVWDVYSSSYYSDNFDWVNPLGPATRWAPIYQSIPFVARGGSTNSNWDVLRNAVRFGWNDDEAFYVDFGFRVARNR